MIDNRTDLPPPRGMGFWKRWKVTLSWQNLDEVRREFITRWRHGRAWLRIGKPVELTLEWCLAGRARSCHLGAVLFGDETMVSAHVGIPRLFDFYFGLTRHWSRKRILPRSKSGHGWEIGATIHGGALWINLFHEVFSGFSTRDSFWKRRTFTITPMDLIFGHRVYNSEEIEMVVGVLIPMTEGTYQGTAKRTRDTWTRPRWPWYPLTIERRSWSLNVEGGIPHPGKGENSWDCGEDATIGMGSSKVELEGAVADFVEIVLRNRRRYGGSLGWVPKDRPVVMAPARKKKS